MRWISLITNLYPVWTLAASAAAFFVPEAFLWFSGPWIVWGLAVIMLGMGITLGVEDFRRVWDMPRAVALGFVGQYTIMPALGWSIAHLMALPPPFAVGLILVACCPGGTASNVVTYLARGNLALSVIMTMVSTLAAVVMTPLLTQWLAGQFVPVDGWGILVTTLQVVIAPVLLGVFLNHRYPQAVATVSRVGPLISVLVIVMIAGSIVAQNATAIAEYAGRLAMAAALLHSLAFVLGYFAARLFGFGEIIARTVSIEVGMQNSGLAMVLAKQHFSDPLTAVPAAFCSVFHSIVGSLAAGYWRLHPIIEPDLDEERVAEEHLASSVPPHEVAIQSTTGHPATTVSTNE